MPRTNFTKALNDIIYKKNLSDEHLKRIIWTNELFIKRLKNGEVSLTLEMMDKIAKRLGCILKVEFEEVEDGR